ncbi:MAG: hypothetical protein ACLKAO_13050 [Alkaliphilus sp.]
MRNYRRRRLKRKRYLEGITSEVYRIRNKTKKSEVRKKAKNIKQTTCRKSLVKSQLLGFIKDSEFNKKCRTNIEGGKAYILIPEVFSFIENPDETLRTLQKILFLSLKKGVNELFLDHSRCKVLHICASIITDIILVSAKKQRKHQGKKLVIKGKLSSIQKIREILVVSGIINHLGLNDEVECNNNIKKLDLICGDNYFVRLGRVIKNSGGAATKIIEYFKKCLNTQGFELVREGENYLGEMIGEVIANCEDHSGEYGEWYSIGHYSIDEHNGCGEFTLTILNFGQTIYEGLKYDIISEKLKKDLTEMSNLQRGFLGLGDWNEENLWTLYALQDGVSRKKHEGDYPDRGSGTIKLIHNFQNIGYINNQDNTSEKPLMSITSGNTHILFNDEYSLKTEKIDGEERQVIAFNKENNLKIPPDSKNVKRLQNYFPGTIISMKSFLDREYLESRMGGNDEQKNN